MDLLETCCMQLTSTKITDRKRGQVNLDDLLDKSSIIKMLNNNEGRVTWNDIVRSVHLHLLKESELLKKNQKKRTNDDLLVTVVQKANKGKPRVSAVNLIQYVLQCFETPTLKEFYFNTYIRILRHHILSQSYYLGLMDEDIWITILNFLKTLSLQENFEDTKVIECIKLIFKHGPQYKYPVLNYRQHFEYITKLCKNLQRTLPSRYKAEVFQIVIDFCNYTAPDCCLSCCKLGEEIFFNLHPLYQRRVADDCIRELLFQFCLLQIKIHHPYGASSNNVEAYAHDWDRWKKQLRTIYMIVEDELVHYSKMTMTKTPFLYQSDNILVLLAIAVCKQIFLSDDVDINVSTSMLLDSTTSDITQSSKRLRLNNVGFDQFVSSLQESKSYPRVFVLTELLKIHPEVINFDQSADLLKILVNMYKEVKNEHVYDCFTTILDIQSKKFPGKISEVEDIWNFIADEILRSLGIQQNASSMHSLLQSLIHHGKIKDPSVIYQTYLSGSLILENYTLKTLLVMNKYFGIPDVINGEHCKKKLINWITEYDHTKSKVFSGDQTLFAQTLVCLCLKQSPEYKIIESNHHKRNFEDVFILNGFQKLIKPVDKPNESQEPVYSSIHKDLLMELKGSLHRFLTEFTQKDSDLNYIQNAINAVILVGYVIVELNVLKIQYNIENLLQGLEIEQVFITICQGLCHHFSDNNLNSNRTFIDTLKVFNKFLTNKFDKFVAKTFRGFIKTELLSCIFELVLDDGASINMDVRVLNLLNERKETLRCILRNFSMYDDNGNATDAEEKTILSLLQCNYEDDDGVDLAMSILGSIKHCQVGRLSEEMLQPILEVMAYFWKQKSKDYDVALKILDTCQSLVQHMRNCTSNDLNQQYFGLLANIFCHQNKYGFEVSIKLLECYQLIIENKLQINYKKYTNCCLSQHICNFLKSHYHLVRLKTIDCLISIFSKSINEPSINSLQKSISDIIDSSIQEVFVITEKLNEDSVIDENVSRTSSVLHTYCSLIFTNSIWRTKFLYSLLSLILDKKLDMNLSQRALNLLAEDLNYKSIYEFIDKHISYILSQWYLNRKSLDTFPYGLTGCDSYQHFCKNYMKVIVPLQLNENIEEICNVIGNNKREIFEICFVELMVGYFFKVTVKKFNAKEIEAANKFYAQIEEELSKTHLKELLITNIDNVLISILSRVVDDKIFKTCFDMEYVLEINEYPRSCIPEILNVISNKIEIQDFLTHCISKHPEKIQSILLNLAMNVYTTTSTQHKLKSLHQYFGFIDMVISIIITPNCEMANFFIRNVLHTLLYFIEMKTGEIKFNSASTDYLISFIKKIVSNCHDKLEPFFEIIVTKLLTLNEELPDKCTDVLRLLIVENEEIYKDIIPNLDPFPETDKLLDIIRVYKRLRIEKWGTSLSGEIQHFLDAGSSINMFRLEALKQLKKKLSENKSELKEMFEVASNVRDFSEEKRKNKLYRLVGLLVKFISSDNTSVSIESARCLGEIGVSNLATLILQSDDICVENSSSPIQLLTSHLIKTLYQSIIDQDIYVVQHASVVLQKALSTKEGVNFMKTAADLKSYFYPFLTKQQKASALSEADKKMMHDNNVDVSNSWWYTDDNHKTWLIELTCVFLRYFSKTSYLQSLIPLCKINIAICEKILPYLIYLYASIKDRNLSTLSKQLNYFLNNVWELSLNEKNINTNKILSTHCVLDAVSFYKTQSKNYDIDNIQLDYLKLAQAAFYSSRFFDSIYYIELWCQSKAEDIPKAKKFTGSPLSLLDLVCGAESSSICLIAQNILRRSYNEIGETDALNGCGHAFLLDTSTRIEHYKELNQWEQVTLHYDTLLSQGNTNIQNYISESLMNCGYYALATEYHEVNNLNYDILWRLGRYDCDTRQESSNPFEKQKYIALKSLFDQDQDMFSNAIYEARLSVIKSCKENNLQTTKSLYGILTNLQMLQELEDIANMGFEASRVKFEEQDSIPKVDFKSYEPIKVQRIVILTEYLKNRELSTKIDVETCKEYLVNLYLDFAASAREAKQFNIAKRAISSLSTINPLKDEYRYKKVLEEGKICWNMGDKITARYLIHELFSKNDNIRLNFSSMKLYGQWMAESQSENPQTILNTYFLEPLKLMKSIDKEKEDLENIFGTYYDIARFSDLEYQRIRTYIKSAEFQRKIQNKEKSRETAEKIRLSRSMEEDERKAAHIYLKQSMLDDAEIDNTLKGKAVYLKLAIKYYMINLQYSDVNNTRIFRVLSLWLENRTSDDLKKCLDEYVSKIPSYKFVPILPQLVPHLSNNSKDDFANHVSSIIERCAKDHPHHTLPILISLSHSNMDDEFVKTNASTDSNETRVDGAQKLLNKFNSNNSLKKIINEMVTLSKAFMELAYLDPDKCKSARGKNEGLNIPETSKIAKISNLSESYLPTITVDIRKNCQYKDIISVHSFKKQFALVGGINRPKSILCECSDGKTRRLLVKGKDDLRQDAVMQQVFTIMNDLFRSNNHTSKLLIRTYKVAPLSKRSGVIEWVENSQVLCEHLYKLHNKYRPNDWSCGKCSSQMKSAHLKSNEEKSIVFKRVCENLMPVMHKFFQEKYPDPIVWYERRRAFTHSLATNSICGYILGLGDRHVGNILLDENTAEVIHIDFGIAFEQGKLLPTPETVPFRLTRDLEDGMGVTGVNGIFRRSCEKTMEVLRHNWETIVSILEVLLYDPLYAWTITPAEAYSRQHYDDCSPKGGSMNFGSDNKENLNVTAERALLRLHQKLHGTEEGASASVEGQVEKLIQQARDHSNLHRLYYGWQAYL
ncbi:serine-protein kinase ATM [Onthophagus taurus]|uniref:serine-protein kinase ATM n=1 Tax=Onthophagus taurus TaxID=166361 RepID=UPI0039BE2869